MSRGYYSRLASRKKSAQFFGTYNIFGKFAAILGPTGQIAGNSR